MNPSEPGRPVRRMSTGREDQWYDRLATYFPDEELKSRGQIQDLIVHHPAYHKLETDRFLLLFAVFSDFVFIDYLLVYPGKRGRGLGSAVLEKLKAMDRRIVAEVEPTNPDDPDTERRARFYERQGLKRAEHIMYRRRDEHGHPHRMDIYFWSPSPVSELEVLNDMFTVCEELHNYRSLTYYGREVANPEDVLRWQ